MCFARTGSNPVTDGFFWSFAERCSLFHALLLRFRPREGSSMSSSWDSGSKIDLTMLFGASILVRLNWLHVTLPKSLKLPKYVLLPASSD